MKGTSVGSCVLYETAGLQLQVCVYGSWPRAMPKPCKISRGTCAAYGVRWDVYRCRMRARAPSPRCRFRDHFAGFKALGLAKLPARCFALPLCHNAGNQGSGGSCARRRRTWHGYSRPRAPGEEGLGFGVQGLRFRV